MSIIEVMVKKEDSLFRWIPEATSWGLVKKIKEFRKRKSGMTSFLLESNTVVKGPWPSMDKASAFYA